MNMKSYPHLGEAVYEKKLPNGLLVRVVPKAGFAKTYAFMAVNYGSLDSTFAVDGKTYEAPLGVAHYLEHKMFDMPEGNVMQAFSQYGGNPNAFTSYDFTAYYVECSDHVKENLEILLRYVTTPYFTKESVQKEQGIIAQEIRMYEDSADSCVYENLYTALFANHPIRNNIAGTVESISHITEQTLYDCYHAFYTMENMMLCVVGDVDPEMVAELAERVTPDCAVKNLPVRNYGVPEQMVPAQKRIEKNMEVSMPMFAIGFKTEPPKPGMDIMVQELIGELAAEILVGESSPLYTRLYEQNLIDSGFSSGYESLRGVSLLSVSGDSVEPDTIYEAVLAEADRIRREGIDGDAFERLKRSSFGRRIRDLDSFESICYRMCAYHFEETEYFDFPEIFHAVTTEQVADFLDRTVRPERAAISVIWPNA